ncbi:hypothetical protein IG631_01707 [Alternaria alternata]|nr:hypothetical protein IG631_01707 [Alternaria alternata]
MGAMAECDRSQILIGCARQVPWFGPKEQACFLACMAMNDREQWSGRRQVDTWRTMPKVLPWNRWHSSALGVSTGF